MKKIIVLALAWLSIAISSPLNAQTFPSGPVTLVVPYPPGGQIDILARMVQQKLQSTLGQPVVVENKPGSGGNLGTAYALRAAPDGQTILLTTNAVMTLNPLLYSNIGFDPATAIPLSLFSEAVVGIAVNGSLPVKNIPDLIAYAKANPGKVTFASSGTPQQVIGEMLNTLGNVRMQYIPYKGVAPALTDLVGGHINVVLATITSIQPFIGTNSVRLIGVSGKTRLPQFPDVQTIAESYPEIEMTTWSGFFAPPGTPKRIVDRLSTELIGAAKSPEIAAKLGQTAEVVVASTPDEAAARVKAETARWGHFLKQVKISVE